MKSKFLLILTCVTLIYIPYTVFAFPSTINYQGYLTSSDNEAISGTVDMTFYLYEVEKGGEPLWNETHYCVEIDKGYFYVNLGSEKSKSLLELPFDKGLHLAISVSGEEMGKRIKLNSVGSAIVSQLAMEAKTVSNGSITSIKIANGAITKEKIAQSAITSNQIADNSITTQKIADKAVTSDKIIDGSDSNLDADLLDGKNSSEFVLKNELLTLNKGTIIQMVAGEPIHGTEKPVPIFQSIKDTSEFIFTKQDKSCDDVWVKTSNSIAQTFKINSSINRISKIYLKFNRGYSAPGNCYIMIYSASYYYPKGSPLSTLVIPISQLNGEKEFIFEDPVVVEPNANYAIVIKADIETNVLETYFCASYNDAYPNGSYCVSSNSGQSWKNGEAEGSSYKYDLYFKVYGYFNYYGDEGKVYACDGSNYLKTSFLGFATSNAQINSPVTIQLDGIVSGFNNLEIGKKYYVDTSGNIGTSQGLYNIIIGQAITPNDIFIIHNTDL